MKTKISLLVLLTMFAGCGSIKSKRIEVQTSSPNVWDDNPGQSVSVKVVCEL